MLHTTKVNAADLLIGMYVSALDRPWLETPFPIQGFVLENQQQIEQVKGLCEFVYVDRLRSHKGGLKAQTVHAAQPKQAPERPRVPIEHIFRGRKLKAYPEETPWQEEHPRAEVALDTLMLDIVDVFGHVSDGGSLDVVRVKGAVSPIVESMSRNPDACMWLTRLKKHDHYSYQHALSASIWAVALGRQLGLERRDLRSIAMGGMLMDVGKLRVSQGLLHASRELNEQEEDALREHVESGVALLKDKGMMNQDVLDMVAHHHERYDGSGYPNGLRDDQIPPVARIAGIVDAYDALTTQRSYAPAVSPSDAIRTLYNARDREFQAELVEAFIQAVGIYPTGTLVELTSGEVAVVVAESRTRRMLPKVTVLLDAGKNRLPKPRMLDLLKESETSAGPELRISRSVQPGAFDIDLAEVAPPAS